MNDQLNMFNSSEYISEQNTPNINKGKPRIKSAVRNQVEFINASLDDLLPDDHSAKNIWEFISMMDLSSFLNKIDSTSCSAGRPAIDPKILLALWIYATTEGIGSARIIDRYCSEHIAFKWLCGGVSVNYHTISDFRKNNAVEFDDLITQFIARLMERKLVNLKRVSQDGIKVRASASTSSFRRKPRLKEFLAMAKEQVETLRKEIDENSAHCSNRQNAARKRAVDERKKRVEQAVKEYKKIIVEKGKAKKKTA